MSTVSGISNLGLASGFDTAAAVTQLLQPEQAKIDSLTAKQTDQTNLQNELSKFSGMIQTLRNTAVNMSTSNNFFAYTASLSSSSSTPASSLLSVSGTNSVSAGKHSIIVQQLAAAQKDSSSAAIQDVNGTAVTSDTTALGLAGSFTVNGQSVTVTAADSLQDIAANINQLDVGSTATGVTATVMKAGTSDYRLVLTSDATGAANAFTLAGADLSNSATLGKLNLGTPTVLQPAQDAQLSVDGLTITRDTNQISDALSGVTMNLLQADPATTLTMDVSVDTTSLRNNVQTFVDNYNSVMDYINQQYVVDPKTGQNGILAGESVLRSVQSTLSSSLLQTIPGLASDRNSLVKIGVEPDSTGHLSINDTLFTNILNNDPNTIRDLFVAQGSSSNTQLSFLVSGLNTTSGTYNVNVTTAPSQASVTGTNDVANSTLGTYTAGAADTVSITETNGARLATVSLASTLNQSGIISALNNEFQTSYTEKHQLGTALTDTSTGLAATGSTTLSNLGLGVAANDTITISGTDRYGGAVSGTYTTLNPGSDTLSSLLSSIQTAFNQQVVASIDASGHVVITDTQSGDSLLTLTLTANNQGGGTLNFGADTVVTEGRYPLGLQALASGNGVEIRSKGWGSTTGFSISQSVDGLGITNQTVNGTDVAGTINGLAATGSGQMLTGSTGAVDGLSIAYSGTTTGSVGSVDVGVGIGAMFEGGLDTFSNPYTGMLQQSIDQSKTTYDSLGQMINDAQLQMNLQKQKLTDQFSKMQSAMNSLQATGNFLTQYVNAGSSSKTSGG